MRKQSISRLCILVLCSFSIGTSAFAQNYSHYWSHQFGREGIFLSGAVLAGPEDNTAAIYNPAALSFTKGEGIGLSFLSGGLSSLNFRDALGDEINLKQTALFVLPKFLAFDIPVFKNTKGHLVFTLFHKDFLKLRQNFREVFTEPERPNQAIINSFHLEKDQQEVWAGLAYAYPISKSLSAGITLFVPRHSHEYDLTLRKDRTFDNFPGLLEEFQQFSYTYNYSLFALQTKLGLTFIPPRMENLRLGLTFTTPSFLHVAAKGDYYYRFIEFQEDPPAGLPPNPGQFDNANLDAKATYKFPMALGVGAQYAFTKLTLYASAEHFFGIDPYIVIDANRNPYGDFPLPDEWPLFPLYHKSDPITNLAFGLSYQLKDGIQLLGGFQTDRNYYTEPIRPQEEATILQTFNSGWNVFHLSLGTSLLKNQNEIAIGLRYSFSFENNVLALGNINDPNSRFLDFAEREDATADVRYNAISIALTYNFFKEFL